MKSIGKWQIISIISRITASIIGIAQTFIIMKFVTLGEKGIIDIAIGVGASLGIYQHLGLASASTREISAAKNKEDIFKIFFTSVFIRYFISIPLALWLILFAGKIAAFYGYIELVIPLRIYGVTLLFQAVQSILNSVIQGTKQFKELFSFQVIIALVNFILTVYFVWKYGINGFFWSYLIQTIFSVLILSFISFYPLRDYINFPTLREIIFFIKQLFSISAATYLIKVIYTNWEKFGPVVLGKLVDVQAVGLYTYAEMFSKKIIMVSDAVTDVNLSVFSDKYENDLQDFFVSFKNNFSKVFSFLVVSSTVAAFWAQEIVNIIVYLLVNVLNADKSYQLLTRSTAFIPFVLLAFLLYSLTNIIKSSVLIPAKMVRDLLSAFILMYGTTAGIFFGLLKLSNYVTFDLPSNFRLFAMAFAMALGSAISFIYMNYKINSKFKFVFIDYHHYLIIIQAFAINYFGTMGFPLYIKILTFPVFSSLLLWGIYNAKFVTIDDVKLSISKVLSKLSTRK